MAYLKDYQFRKCTDGLWRSICNGYVLPSTLVPEKYWEGERGFATKQECIDDMKRYTYRPSKY